MDIKISNVKMINNEIIQGCRNLISKLKINNQDKFIIFCQLTGRKIKNENEITTEEWEQLLIQLSLNLYKDTKNLI